MMNKPSLWTVGPIAILCLLFVGGVVGQDKPSKVNAKYEDVRLTPEERAADLVSHMTLEEKVSQMQNSALAIPRLHVPEYDWWNEALHGVARSGLATVFPQAIGLAATWDTDLELRIADAISTEARAKYNDAIEHGNRKRYYGLTFWSPNINLFRDPRWGRGQETYGEDPYLTSRMAIAFIKGMQGNDPHYFKTIATSKHFAVHSGPESSRHQFDAKVSTDELNDTYLYAFRATLTEGGADSVMCAYNRLNGDPACASDFLLKDKLRGAWNFKGYVVGDCGAVDDIYRGHHWVASPAEASAKAVKAGTDLDCGRTYRTLVDAVKQGYITETEINRSVERLFVARFRLGMFDPPQQVPFSKIRMAEVESPAHQKLALEAARKSIVLLKNEGNFLPFHTKPKRIAVLGPAADDPNVLLANYNGIPSHLVTPLQGIQEKFGKSSQIRFALGATYVDSAMALVPSSVLRSSKGETGLLAEYFATNNLSGAPVLSRVEKRPYLVWDMHDPAVVQSVPRQAFSSRWSGVIEVATEGDYQFGIVREECHSCGRKDSARVYIDDQLQITDDTPLRESMYPKAVTVHLEAGKPRAIRIEYEATGGDGGLQLVWKQPADVALQEAMETVKQSDVAILCLGLNAHLEGEESKVQIPGFSGGDRTNIDLPASQEKLLQAVLHTGKPVVVVLLNGSALAVKTAKDDARAVLEAWYPGQEGGMAIADTLRGENNPAGRLPVTFYQSVEQLPPFDDYSMKERTYRFFTGEPLYPFGFGLSYSDFQYSHLSIQTDASSAKYVVTADVTNRSRFDGEEVVQLYLSDANGARPLLRGFQRVALHHGAKTTVRFLVDQADAKSKDYLSVGGGQPLRAWTGEHFIQERLPR